MPLHLAQNFETDWFLEIAPKWDRKPGTDHFEWCLKVYHATKMGEDQAVEGNVQSA